MNGVYGATAPNLYNFVNAPTIASAFIGGIQVYPIPGVGDFWMDPTVNVFKKCTSNNPFVWASIEGGGTSYSDAETPTGVVNGVNAAFVLAHAPSPALGLILTKDGVVLQQGIGKDYTIAGTNITFVVAPLTGSIIIAWYRY